MKEVSIIMPVYNAQNTINKTIESILNQEYDNYELIIVNDHSTDNTEEICITYEKENNGKIKFYNNLKGKKGVSSARNYGISLSNSKYIMFIDSDDTYQKDMLLEMVNNIQENDLAVCGVLKRREKHKDEINNYDNEYVATNINQFKEIIEELQRKDLFNEPWNKIFKSEIIKENNIKFQEDISLGEDYRFVIDYVEKCKRIKNTNKVLYIYNIKESGLASTYDKNNLKIRLDNLIYHKNFYIRNNLNIYYLDKLYILAMYSGLGEIVRNNNRKNSKQIIKEYMSNKEINDELSRIYNNKKLKLFVKILETKNVHLLYFLGKFYNLTKKIYKCIKSK